MPTWSAKISVEKWRFLISTFLSAWLRRMCANAKDTLSLITSIVVGIPLRPPWTWMRTKTLLRSRLGLPLKNLPHRDVTRRHLMAAMVVIAGSLAETRTRENGVGQRIKVGMVRGLHVQTGKTVEQPHMLVVRDVLPVAAVVVAARYSFSRWAKGKALCLYLHLTLYCS